MEKLGGTLGYLIGAIIIVPLVFTLIDKYSINRNEFSNYMKEYLEDTEEIIVESGYFETDPLSEGHLAVTKGFTTKMAATSGRDVSSRSRRHYRRVRSHKNNKIFIVNVIDGTDLVFSAIDNNKFIARVNIDDLNDGHYGTFENPIPVFYVRGIDKPLQFYNRKGDMVQLDISEEQYAYSAEMYWTYIATKEEFERRFEKQK